MSGDWFVAYGNLNRCRWCVRRGSFRVRRLYNVVEGGVLVVAKGRDFGVVVVVFLVVVQGGDIIWSVVLLVVLVVLDLSI